MFFQQMEGFVSIGTNLWQEYFTIFELNKFIRQKNGLEFAQFLNRTKVFPTTEFQVPEHIDTQTRHILNPREHPQNLCLRL